MARPKKQSPNPEEARKEFIAARDNHIEILKSECASYDKAILQLSAAAIGVSIVFLEKIAKNPPVEVHWIKAAWTSLVGSLGIIVFSYIASQHKLRREIYELESNYYNPPKDGEQQDDRDPYEHPRFFSGIIRPRFLNVCSGLLLILGFVFLAVFATANL